MKQLIAIMLISISLTTWAQHQFTTVTLRVGGADRTMKVYAPSGLQNNRPLLISLHGLNQDPDYQQNQARWEQVADTAKFVVVYPRAVNLSWDISGDRDINLILAIIDDMRARYGIDKNRVYVTGFSMGGMMSYHAANKIADKVAAIGPVGGYLFANPVSSSRPMPIIHAHGTSDDVVGYSGLAAILQKWRNWNKCPSNGRVTSPYPANRPGSRSSRTDWGPCDAGSEVVLLTLDGKGHWHSNDENSVHTTRELWTFLRKFSLGSGPVISFTSPADNASFIQGASISLTASASSPNGGIRDVKFYNGTTLLNTDNTAPYSFNWANAPVGRHQIKAVVTDNQGETAEVVITVRVNVPQSPYGGTAHKIPGTIQLEEFDLGGNGFAYLDNTPGSETGVNFRADEDVDIEVCTDAGGGYNIGYATAGEWLEYTVQVGAAGKYDLDLRVAASGTGRTLSITMDGKNIASNVSIPNTNGWQSWQTITVRNVELVAGTQVMRVTVGETDYVNMNYVEFKAVDVSLPPVVSLTGPSNNASYGSNETVRLTATASDPDGSVSQVDFYAGDLLIGSVSSAPYSVDWSRMNPGVYSLIAVATDNKGIITTSSPVSVTIRAVQAPFNGAAHMIPGRIEAEEYDLGGEGLGYHEANTNGNEGKAPFRNDEVDIEETGDDDGVYNVGYILEGEWLQYSVEVLASGVYDLNLRMAAEGSGKTLHVEMDGVDVTGPIQVPNTGGWQVWETVTVRDVNLTAGEHVMRIVFGSDYMNLNYVEFTDVVTGTRGSEYSGIKVYPNPFNERGLIVRGKEDFTYRIMDISGMVIETGMGGVNEQVVGVGLKSGMYFLTIENREGIHMRKIQKY